MSSLFSQSPLHSNPSPLSHTGDITIPPEKLAEERAEWLCHLKSESPQLFTLRERVLPWTGGHSFANLVYADTAAVNAHVNRFAIIELIYQHLNAIGLFNTAETLQDESQLKFQLSKQPWEKTTLLLLVSLGVLPNENPWTIPIDPHHHFVEEPLEEDFFASPYRDPNMSQIYLELEKPDYKAIYSNDSNNKQTLNTLKKGSLNRLVVLVTTTGDQHALQDMTRFFLSLHAITSSEHFLEHLITMFDLNFAEHPNIPYTQPQLRLMIVNLIKRWVNEHGKFIGNRTIKAIGRFLRRVMEDPSCQNVYKYTQTVLSYLPVIQYGPKNQSKPTATETPVIPNYQILFQPNLKIIDPDPTEVARQITLLFHNAFKVVHSREFIIASRIQGISHQTPTLAEFFDFGVKLTLLTFETIISAADVGAAITKTLQIAEALDKLNNFHALACVIRALKQRIIQKHPVMQTSANIEKFKFLDNRSGDNMKKINEYNETVKDLFEHCFPAIPNMMAEFHTCGRSTSSNSNASPSRIASTNSSPASSLSPYDNISILENSHSGASATGASSGVPGTIDLSKSSPTIDSDGLINWNLIWTNSYKALMFYWFQFKCRPYLFYAIPQIQDVINRGPLMTKEQLKWEDDSTGSFNAKNSVLFDKSTLKTRKKTLSSFDTSKDGSSFASSYS